MNTVKTAVSLPAELYAKSEKLRKKLNKSRSELFADALAAMIRSAETLEKEERDRAAYRNNPESPSSIEEGGRRAEEALNGYQDDWSEDYNAAR